VASTSKKTRAEPKGAAMVSAMYHGPNHKLALVGDGGESWVLDRGGMPVSIPVEVYERARSDSSIMISKGA
jgi:hypothetical protein